MRGDTEPFGGGVLWRAFCALFNDLFCRDKLHIYWSCTREKTTLERSDMGRFEEFEGFFFCEGAALQAYDER